MCCMSLLVTLSVADSTQAELDSTSYSDTSIAPVTETGFSVNRVSDSAKDSSFSDRPAQAEDTLRSSFRDSNSVMEDSLIRYEDNILESAEEEVCSAQVG